MKNCCLFVLLIFIISCTGKSGSPDMNMLKEEIRTVEMNFARMAADSGIEAAFLYYAAPGAVLKRGNNLVIGFDSIAAYLKESTQPGESLSWSPDFIDVSVSGDMAYTYGKFVYSFPDSAGVTQKQQGFFHTVWKRQPDGKWKFVWD